MRSLLAVLIGYCVFGASAVLLFRLSGVNPHSDPGLAFQAGSTLYGMVFAAAGGYTAARIAGKRELMFAGFVAGILALLAAVSIAAQPGLTSYWSQIAAIVFMAPSALVGGWLRKRQVEKAQTKQ